jgi:hypothetical protein
MDAALQAFLITLAIVAGILSPIIIIMLLSVINSFLAALAARLNIAVVEVKKRPPFTDVEVNVNPATNVMTVRFDKDGVPIWQGSSSRREMEENNILRFNTEKPDDGR